jgi:hypothetical protein
MNGSSHSVPDAIDVVVEVHGDVVVVVDALEQLHVLEPVLHPGRGRDDARAVGGRA